MTATCSSPLSGSGRHSTAPAAMTRRLSVLPFFVAAFFVDLVLELSRDALLATSTPANQFGPLHRTGSGGSQPRMHSVLPMSFHQPHLMVADLSAVLRCRGPVAVGTQFPAARRRIHRRLE